MTNNKSRVATRTAHILVVDDEKVILDLTTLILQNRGFNVVGVTDYPSALSSLDRFDVIVADMKIGDSSCKDLLIQASEIEDGPAVIALAGKGSEEEAVEIMRLGAYDYILKPFNNQHLVERIEQVHTRRSLEKEISRLKKLSVENENDKIVRSIEFEPEYYQAGLSILSYFNTIANQKYPDMKIKVKIEQEGTAVRMLIQTPDGRKEEVEKTLDEYGLVVLGQLQPEKFLHSPYEVMALKNKLEISALELRQTKELYRLAESSGKARIDSLEDQIRHLNQHVADGLRATHKSNDIIAQLLSSHQLTTDVVDNIRHILSKLDKGLVPSDEQEVKRLLNEISVANPKALYDFKDFLRDSVVGVSGNFLYSWIVSIIACLPK